jgi:hypothetical protein
MKEKSIEQKLKDKVERAGGQAIKFYSQTFTGLPDRIVMMPSSRLWFVETKAPGKKVKDGSRQALVHKQFKALGFDVRVVATPEQLQEFLKEINA